MRWVLIDPEGNVTLHEEMPSLISNTYRLYREDEYEELVAEGLEVPHSEVLSPM